jgi:molecular chaperone GrpE
MTKENINNEKTEEIIKSPEQLIIEELNKSIESLTKEKDEIEKKLLRTKADIQNIKRQSDKNSIQSRFKGKESMVMPTIETLDDFSRALESIPEDIKNNEFIKSLFEVKNKLIKKLEKEDIIFFGKEKEKFDANLHESLMLDKNIDKGMIAKIFEKGVKMNDRIIRHAKVSVGDK